MGYHGLLSLCKLPEAQSRPSRPTRKVAHRELYDLLGVPPEVDPCIVAFGWRPFSVFEAAESEIRRAFYKKSLVRSLEPPDSSCRRPTASFAASPLRPSQGPPSGQESRQPGSHTEIPGFFFEFSMFCQSGQVFRIFLSSDEMCKYDAIYCIYQTEMTHFEPLV